MLFICHFSPDHVQIKEFALSHFPPLFVPTTLSEFEIHIWAYNISISFNFLLVFSLFVR